MGKFDDLFYTMPVDHHNWANYASPRCGYRGNLAEPSAGIYLGFSVATKENWMEVPHMHHAKDEYLIFHNADLNNFFDFDAEVEVWLGDDPLRMEKITITAPTIIRVPPNLWHCPINFKRIGKPICFTPLYLDGSWSKITRIENENGQEEFRYDGAGIRRCVYDRAKSCTYCGKCFSAARKEKKEEDRKEAAPPVDPTAAFREMEKLPRTGNFDKYVYTIKPDYHQWGDTYANPRGGYPGVTVDAEAKLYYGYDVIYKEHTMEEPHFHNAVPEYLIFTGANLVNPFDFDAEIEIMVGDDPDNMEKHVITAPTVVRIPPNVWHCPINFKRVTKPVNFMPIYLDGSWSKITRRFLNGDDTPTYVYDGVGVRRCTYDKEKLCDYCGKCFAEKMEEAKDKE